MLPLPILHRHFFGQPASFEPVDSLPDLQFLYDHKSERRANSDGSGSLVTTNNTAFKWWEDRSGNGLHVSHANGAILHVNGSDRVTQFSGGDKILSSSWTPGTLGDYTIHYVMRRIADDIGCVATLLASGGSSFFGAPWTVDTVTAPGMSAGSPWPARTKAIYVAITRSGTTLTVYVNGTPVTTATNSTTITPGVIQLGRYSTTTYTNFYLSSLAFATSAHSQAQIQSYYNWLRTELHTEFGRSSNLALYLSNSLGTASFSGLANGIVQKVHTGGLAPSFTHYLNASVSSKTTTMMQADYLTRIVPLADTTTGRVVIFLWEGTNDMVVNGASGATAAANIFTLVQSLNAAFSNVKVVVGTVIDRNASGWSASSGVPGTKKADFNNAIVDSGNQSTYGYTVADFTGVATVSGDGANANATYFADGVHLTSTGNGEIDNIVGTAMESALSA